MMPERVLTLGRNWKWGDEKARSTVHDQMVLKGYSRPLAPFLSVRTLMIPDYQSLMRPVLECAKNGPRKMSEVVEELSDKFALTPDERAQLLPSGKQTTIANRVHWARSYMKQAGLVRNLQRGWYELTERGREILNDPAVAVNAKYLERFSEFQEFRSRARVNGSDDTTPSPEVEAPNTPDESLEAAHSRLRLRTH